MAREGLSARAGAGVLAGAVLSLFLLIAPKAPAQERENPIATTLAVQTALQQGHEHLLRGNPQAAVYVLESQLARINGSREYLTMLRDAYRAYIKELRLANKESEAEEYLKRLRILDPGAGIEGGTGRPAPVAPAAVVKAPTAAPIPLTPKARGKVDDAPDPFRLENAAKRENRGLLEQAEKEFLNRRYDAAAHLFEQASRTEPALNAASKEQWAYCKFYRVVQQLNQPPAGGPAYNELEQEVQTALGLAPRLEDYGKGLLRKIEDRKATAQVPETGALPVEVRHSDSQANGWALAESTNFRIYHNQPRELAERVAQVAERTRLTMQRKWFGDANEDWNPRCDLFLYASGQDYSKATGVPATSPGHSTIRAEGGRVVRRKMDLHCDDPNMLIAVLPHETTHVVLAGRFGEFMVPRWADEGVAVLSEPHEKIERHLRNLPQHRRDQQLFPLKQLIQLDDYPDPRYIGSFYAESVSLVEFLTHEKGPQTFTQFVRDGLRGGYEDALRRHYGINDFTELEQRWQRYAFADAVTAGK